MKIIARVRSDFPTKFGIPRQSGLVPELKARIVFEPEYRTRMPYGGWISSRISGCSGSFPKPSGIPGPQR